MQPIEFFQSKAKSRLLLVALVICYILYLYLIFVAIQKEPMDWVDWVRLVFCLVIIVIGVATEIKGRNRSNRLFAISDEGIEIDMLNNLVVPWVAIATVRLQCIDELGRRGGHQGWYLAIRVNDTAFLEQYSDIQKRLRSFKKKKAYRIQLSLMEMKPQEIYELCTPYIKAHCPNQNWQEYHIERDAELWPKM